MERFLGINIEYECTNKAALAGLVAVSTIFCWTTGFRVEGKLPKEGPAILVSNHTSSTDIFKGCAACVTTAERIIRGVARESLLDPAIEDPEDVLTRTGKKGSLDPMRWPLVAPTIAFVLNGIGAIPVVRGSLRDPRKDRQFLLSCDEVLKSGQMLGLFLQETRVKEGDLRDVFPGAGVLIRRHPDVPVVPITILNKRWGNKMVIGESTTVNKMEEESGHRLGAREIIALIGDRIAQNHHPIVRIKWGAEDRPKFLKAT